MNQTLTRHMDTTVPAADATPRRRTRAVGPVVSPRGVGTRPAPSRVVPLRREVHRPAGIRPTRPRRGGAECGDARRQAPSALRPAPIGWIVAIVVGAGLAIVMWMMVIGGSVFADSTAPAVSGTEVVHVRGGESLGDIALRVAPDQSASAVIATIKNLNHMTGSALTAGQPLLAPIYRH